MYNWTSGKSHNKDYEPPKQAGNRFGWSSTVPATEPGNESKPEDVNNNSNNANNPQQPSNNMFGANNSK